MRLVAFTFLISFLLIIGSCSREQAVQVSSVAQLESLVGRRVTLVGVVSNTTAPQILGVDLWGLERLAGQRLRVSGILQRTIITRTGGDTSRAVDSGHDSFMQPVFRGPGTYYRLQDLSYESKS